ncbi:MAG: oxygen-independent coproporphyrinogen III oxidase [Chitinophagaceae bacterium]|nr:oxygen-independent coproporphyrinogen III oxidase [Chitinophagaceae bacterium]
MESEVFDHQLIARYNQPVPRYTSYPTVPFWKNNIDKKAWAETFSKQFALQNSGNGISLYIHLPFCESLCTYCGCNKKITTNHSVEETYITAIEKEWQLYRQLMNEKPVVREIHLGGGTPTFFSAQNLDKLLKIFLSNSILHPDYAFSIEGHPNNTTRQHLDTLYALGFRRISYGVQDLDPKVQQVINRIQPAEQVKYATEQARAAGFTSVNFDLIYGLPLQTKESIDNTIREVITLKPERIAFYSYAHVPWTSKAQRLFDESDLPSAEEKIQLYLHGKKLLLQAGYYDVGMDHFSLPEDELYIAKQQGRLHRNFMGYTVQDTGILLGLGVSSISDTGNAFAQNEKTLHDYYDNINNGRLAVNRGYFLDEEDLVFRNYIKDIACNGYTRFRAADIPVLREICFPQLEQPAKDGLVIYNDEALKLTEKGNYFIRNICSAFDLYLQRNNTVAGVKTFSKAI